MKNKSKSNPEVKKKYGIYFWTNYQILHRCCILVDEILNMSRYVNHK